MNKPEKTQMYKPHSFASVLVWLICMGFTASGENPHINEITGTLYQSIDFGKDEKPSYDVFQRAMAGYYYLQQAKKLSEKEILTIIDFRKSGNHKRLWAIDLKTKKLLYHSLVAHGRNSGELYAEKFSNIHSSNQSSLGFFITGNTYIGKHGVSLKLKGVESGINDQAEARAIVMHGADYVSDSYIKKVGRLGRSHGCPAVPMNIYKELIMLLEGRTCLFIFYPDKGYLSKTNLLGTESLDHLALQEPRPIELGSRQ